MSEGKNPDFETFKEYFKKYQQKFGLQQYRIDFNVRRIPNIFAQIQVHQTAKVCKAVFSTGLSKVNREMSNPVADAKHEAIHLLLSRLRWLALSRCTSAEEVTEEMEGLVVKLESLIPDIE